MTKKEIEDRFQSLVEPLLASTEEILGVAVTFAWREPVEDTSALFLVPADTRLSTGLAMQMAIGSTHAIDGLMTELRSKLVEYDEYAGRLALDIRNKQAAIAELDRAIEAKGTIIDSGNAYGATD